MSEADDRGARFWARLRRPLLLGGAALLVLAALVGYQNVFAPLGIALALAYILNPLMRWGTAHRIPRGLMAMLLFLAVLGLTALVTFLALPPLLSETYNLGVSVVGEPAAPEDATGVDVRTAADGTRYADLNDNGQWDRGYVTAVVDRIQEARRRPPDAEPTWIDQALSIIEANRRDVMKGVLNTLRTAGDSVLALLRGLQGFVVAAGLTGFYLFFLLMNFDRVVEAVRVRLPARYKDRILKIVGKIDAAISAFLRGRLIVCLIVGGLTALGLAVLGIPYWFVLGVATGVAGIVPYLPIFVGLGPSMLVAWIDTGNPWLVLGTVIVYVVVQALEGWVLTPLIQGKAVGLHPVTLMVALLLGFEMLGLVGLIAAVPLASTVKILAQEFVLPEVEDMAHERRGRRQDGPGGGDADGG